MSKMHIKMKVNGEEVETLTSHQIGGVCPFGLPTELPIYCDASLKIYTDVIPAAGDTHSSVKLTVEHLAQLTGDQWVDCCTVPE